MVLFRFGKKLTTPTPEEALPGRKESMQVPSRHYVNGNPLLPPYPSGLEIAMFGLGCFWGAERIFWQQDGVLPLLSGTLLE
jgi:peptide-methionine (S)-S-oxide reductase